MKNEFVGKSLSLNIFINPELLVSVGVRLINTNERWYAGNVVVNAVRFGVVV